MALPDTTITLIRVVDLETSGLTEEAEILELATGLVEVSDSATWHSARRLPIGAAHLYGNTRPVPPQARAVHHLGPRELKGHRPWGEAGREDFSMVRSRWELPLVGVDAEHPIGFNCAHNASFERQMLGAIGEEQEWICTYKCALHAFPDAPSSGNAALLYWLDDQGLVPPSMDWDLVWPSHRAAPDVYVTQIILLRLLWDHGLAKLLEWSRAPRLVSRIPFGALKGKPWAEADNGLLFWILGPEKDFDDDVKHAAKAELDRRAAERDEADRRLC